jgi:hypothetical protein
MPSGRLPSDDKAAMEVPMPEDEPREAETTPEEDKAAREQHEVLKVFGVKLTVYNPRLAELLTMEAKEALGKDVSQLVKSGEEEGVTWDDTSRTEEAAREVATPDPAHAMTATIADAGARLGFEVSGHTWASPLGVTIITKAIPEPADLAQAEEQSCALAATLEDSGGEAAGLLVTKDQLACDTFRLAVRKQNLYPRMRVISLQNVDHLLALYEGGTLSHRQVVLLLVPLANIDVGELLNVLEASGDQVLGGA